MAGVIPFSWSTLSAYETCAKQFYEKYIAKSFKEPEAQHLIWGNEVHKAFEVAVTYKQALPTSMQQWNHIAKTLTNAPGTKYCELKTAVNAEFLPTDFWAADCWNRGVEDLLIVNGSKGATFDYKTGKEQKGSDQLALSAARAFAKFPQLETLHSAYIWLQTGNISKAIYRREDVADIWERMLPRVQKMLWSMEHNIWPPKPSGLCQRSKKPGSTYMGCPVTNCIHSANYKKP